MQGCCDWREVPHLSKAFVLCSILSAWCSSLDKNTIATVSASARQCPHESSSCRKCHEFVTDLVVQGSCKWSLGCFSCMESLNNFRENVVDKCNLRCSLGCHTRLLGDTFFTSPGCLGQVLNVYVHVCVSVNTSK